MIDWLDPDAGYSGPVKKSRGNLEHDHSTGNYFDCTHVDCMANKQRVDNLRAHLSSLPCPGCGGSGLHPTTQNNCRSCRGTGSYGIRGLSAAAGIAHNNLVDMLNGKRLLSRGYELKVSRELGRIRGEDSLSLDDPVTEPTIRRDTPAAESTGRYERMVARRNAAFNAEIPPQPEM